MESKRKIDLNKFDKDLIKYSKIPSGRGLRYKITPGLFFLESGEGFKGKEKLFVSELNYILPQEYYCDDPSKAQTIVLLKIELKQNILMRNYRYSGEKEYYYEYSARIINKKCYLGEIIYKGEGRSSDCISKFSSKDFFGFKIDYDDIDDEMFLKFILNTDFSNFTLIDSFSGHIKEVKSNWNNGIIRYEGYYDVVNKVKEGHWKEYYENGILKSEEYYRVGQLNGLCKYYYENGILKEEGNYISARIDLSCKIGKWKLFYENGKIKCEGDYNTNEEWKYYYSSGALKYIWKFMDKDFTRGEFYYAFLTYLDEDGTVKYENKKLLDGDPIFNYEVKEIQNIWIPNVKTVDE